MIGETEGRKGRGREAWKTNEQEPQREFLLVGAGNEAGSLARPLASRSRPLHALAGRDDCTVACALHKAARRRQSVINS